MTDRPSPELAVRILRAKAAELENYVRNASEIPSMRDDMGHVISLAGDIALVAQLLADHIERSPGPWGPEDEGWLANMDEM